MPEHFFHILLIDDTPGLSQKLHQIIGQHSHSFGVLLPKITHKQNENTALLFLNQNEDPVDLIILGRTSEQKYIGVIHQLKSQHKHIPIALFYDNESEKLVNALVKKEVLYHSHNSECTLHTLSKIMALAIAIQKLDYDSPTPTSSKSQKTKSALPDSFFRDIVNTSEEILILVDLNNIVTFANHAASQIFGIDPANLPGKHLSFPITRLESKYFDEHPRYITADFIRSINQIGQTMEMTITLADGTSRDYELRTSHIHHQDEEDYVISLRDVTNSKRIAHLTSEIKEKARIDKLKDEFISIVSHEMRTPLTIVKGAVSNLKDGIVGNMTPSQNKILDTAIRNIDRLARIINDLLDLSRLESGKAKIEKRRLYLKPLISEILSNFKTLTDEKNISVNLELSETIPPVFADADMIIQVITNLLQNALRYAKSQITVQVLFENLSKNTDDNKNMIRLGIIDDGQGIPRNKLETLFDKFEQIDRPQGGSGYKGTGLGLAICRQIINLHNGRIWTVSDTGKGAQFYFLLPAYNENDIFTISLDQTIKEAEKQETELGLLILKIELPDSDSTQAVDHNIAYMINNFLDKIRTNALRKTDILHFKRETREFIIFLNNSNRVSALSVIKRIQKIAEETLYTDSNKVLSIDLRIGLSIYPEDSRYSSELFKIAYEDMNKNLNKEKQ